MVRKSKALGVASPRAPRTWQCSSVYTANLPNYTLPRAANSIVKASLVSILSWLLGWHQPTAKVLGRAVTCAWPKFKEM